MRDEDDRTREAKRAKLVRERKRAHLVSNWIWLIASLAAFFVLSTQWQPQSEWTVAIKWIVLLTPFYYVVDSLVRIIQASMVSDDW